MAAKLLFPEKIVELTLKKVAGVDYSPGDIVGYSTGWVKADADAATNVYGQYILLQGGKGNDVVKACEKVLLFDDDAPYTANTAQYLSGTAGGITETRPTTNGDMIQMVGRSLDTKRCLLDIKKPQEFEMFLRPGPFNALGGAGAIEAWEVDAGWEGPNGDSAAIVCYFTGRLPFGLISLDVAEVYIDTTAATAMDLDFVCQGTYKSGANNPTAVTITAQTTTVTTADNKVQAVSVLTAFDATIKLPGMTFSAKCDPDAGTGIYLGLYLRGMKV
jgi:hypothetical protein